MSSDRNTIILSAIGLCSLVDWDMSSDRNMHTAFMVWFGSLVDWDMSSDRNQKEYVVAV